MIGDKICSMKVQGAVLLTSLLCASTAYGQDVAADKARVALSYTDCDGDIMIRNGRIGLMLGGRFVADTILGATYVGSVLVWGGEDKRYKLLFADDLSKVTMVATNGHGSIDAACHRIPE